MKALIALLIIMGAVWLGKTLYGTYQTIEKDRYQPDSATAPQTPTAPASTLAGLPASLEVSLAAAEKQGAAGLREWLKNYRIYARDPRLASIELDYVILISHQDPAEARRIFNEVKDRTPTFSPIYERVKKLGKSFQ